MDSTLRLAPHTCHQQSVAECESQATWKFDSEGLKVIAPMRSAEALSLFRKNLGCAEALWTPCFDSSTASAIFVVSG